MRLLLILLFSPIIAFSQTNRRYGSDKRVKTSIILRTDVLPLMNTILEKNKVDLGLSSEFCFNTCYSILLNLNIENTGDKNYRQKILEPGTEIRWYLEMNEQAFFHLGIYSFLEFSDIKINKTSSTPQYLYYNQYFAKFGMSGGFRVLLSKKIEMDIASYLGYAKRYAMRVKEYKNLYPQEKSGQFDLRILLSLGYRI